jgi:hypothetical protein
LIFPPALMSRSRPSVRNTSRKGLGLWALGPPNVRDPIPETDI